jgi:integration host factor subunit beta
LAFWAYVFLAAVSPDAGSRLVRAAGRDQPCRPEQGGKSTLRQGSGGRLESARRVGLLAPMIKSELVARLTALNPHLHAKGVEASVSAILGRTAYALVAGGRVELRGFRSFSVNERRARRERNPRTGETANTSAKAFVAFKAAKTMRHQLNPQEQSLK